MKRDFVFLKAFVADQFGNLRYKGIERNFNPGIAGAGRYTIAEVDFIIDEPMKPGEVHTPGIYVDAVIQNEHKPKGKFKEVVATEDKNLERIARRAALELKDGNIVNLGVGMPTDVGKYIPEGIDIFLQSENGILGMGSYATKGEELLGIIDAGKNYVQLNECSSLFDSVDSFGMIRGGHVDITIMGALQVDQYGNLANNSLPGRIGPGIGGGMDLAKGAKRLIITTYHTRKGKSKIKKR